MIAWMIAGLPRWWFQRRGGGLAGVPHAGPHYTLPPRKPESRSTDDFREMVRGVLKNGTRRF